MGKIIDLNNYDKSKIEEKQRKENEEYYNTLYEMMLIKVNELLPILDELGVDETTITKDGEITFKSDFEE